MRIGIEAQRIFRKKRHGMDIVALECIRELQKLDTQNEYFIFVKPGEDNKVLQRSKNFHIIELKGLMYADWEQVVLPLAAKKYKLDLLHCTSNTAPLLGNTPLIVTIHDVIYLEQMNLRKGTWYQKFGVLYRRWNVPAIARKATKIITVSHFEQGTIEQRLQLSKGSVEVVYNGVSEHFTHLVDDETLKTFSATYQLPERFILFLGNTDPKKNVDNTLKGYALACQQSSKLPDLVMLDYGKEALMTTLNDIGAPELIQRIRLTGYIPNTSLPCLYQAATFFLYTSLRESFGIPMLEAMRCGTPVITSTTSAMPEIAADAAHLVNPHDPTSIASGILSLFQSNELRNQLREKGFARSSEFSWGNTAANTLKLYKELAAKH